MERSEEEVQAVIDAANEIRYSVRTKWAGMTFEEGVIAALEWVLGNGDSPLED